MMTKVWGPPGWFFLHCVTFGFPERIAVGVALGGEVVLRLDLRDLDGLQVAVQHVLVVQVLERVV